MKLNRPFHLTWKACAFRYGVCANRWFAQLHGKIIFLITGGLILLLMLPAGANAYSGLVVDIKVVRAVRDNAYVDPELADLAREVGPVLNFTGFFLLKKSEITLSTGASQRLFLPADRSMRFELAGFEKDQARLKIVIYKNGDEIFTTTLLLVDNGSALIGGPALEKGVMMIRISGRFTS